MQIGNARFLVGARSVLSFSVVLLVVGVVGLCADVSADVADLTELSEDEQQQITIAKRFVTVLEKNPRRGTALDRVYGHHVEFGTLDEFVQGLRDRVNKSPRDGTAWMMLGLFETHRGEDANAIDAFKQAEAFRTDDALPSYYLGQSLLLLGQPENAVAAFERAIARKPRRTDLLEIFQQLGRVHQRAQRTEEALKVWQRLESLFPDDARVQEQIAITLVEEGEYALALPRYEKLAQLVRDDYRRTMFRIEAAELKIRMSQREAGIKDFESLLADLNPESWLHRDIRRRIEEVFLRGGDQDGLVTYYEQWISSHPTDVDSMARLAKFLAGSARVPEATEWMGKALKLAPTRTELRKAFIDQLVDDQRYDEAIKQYELLVESAPGNSDFLRDWGKLVLKNKAVDQAVRQAEASRIWHQILAARPDDALTTAQVADLFRQSNLHERALALYQKAVELAPNDPQYREYLGEFYHILKRPQDALATWTAIATGERKTAINVARLAEIYNSFGYLDEAVVQIAAACQLDPKDFALQLKAAEYHSRVGKHDEALAFVANADRLAASSEEQDAVITQRIDVFRAGRRLDREIDSLTANVRGNADATAEQWHLLARYCEADSRWTDATEAIDKALAKDPKSVPTLTTAARISELSGDYARAANMSRQLADVDRRSRGDHLMNVARLEAQMGRPDEALEAGRELIVSAPGNTDNYEFYARLCFQLGKSDEGVDTLRKAVRINPSEPHLITALGAALSNELRADEAIEVYWRAFERSDDLDDKTSLTMKLAELYLQVNQFDKLLERLERDRREADKRHEMTICLSQAHHTSGDYGTARQELESLLSENTRDTNLLQQLSKLCEEGADIDGAIEYQRQLSMIAPGHETEYRLASLLQSRGDRDEASEILVRLMRREEDPARRLRNLDSLLKQGDYETVISLTEPMLSEQHDDWETLYREAVAWASLEKYAEARNRLERILGLPVAHDTFGIFAADKFKQAQAKARSNNLQGIQTAMPQRQSPLTMLNSSYQVRRAVGLDPDRNYYGSSASAPSVWTPSAFGEARMAAYAWLIRFDQEQEANEATDATPDTAIKQRIEKLSTAAALDDASRDTLYDWMYVEQVRGNLDSIFRIARRLARDGGRESQQFFLRSLALRGVDPTSQQVARSGIAQHAKKPLGADDLELMLACYTALTQSDRGIEDAAMSGANIAYGSNGQVYIQVGGSYQLVSGLLQGGIYIGTIIEELKLAGRDELAEKMIQQRIASAKTSSDFISAMQMYLQEEDFEKIEAIFPQWLEAAKTDIANPVEGARATSRRGTQISNPLDAAGRLLMTWMGHLGPEEEHAKILAILDPTLDISAEVADRRRAERSRRRSQTSNQPRYTTYYSLKYGKEDIRVQFDYPYPNEYSDSSTLQLLRQAYEVFNRNEVLDDLGTHLEERLRNASGKETLYATLMLAYFRWWQDDKEDSLALLKQAADELQEDPLFRLEIATLHQSMGDTEDAFEIVEAIVPRDQKLVQRRELLALELAERLGDIDRARQSAERLFGLRLDNDTQLALVGRMRRLGMHEMAEAITSRIQRRSGNSLPSMASLMALYQSQGKIDPAQQLAHTILRRTKTPMSGLSSVGRNPFRYSSNSSESQMRTQALRLLQQTGTLKDLISRTESQIERSPNSPRLYEQLIEYYGASNDRDKVGTLLERAVANRPDAVVLRYQFAKHLESTGKRNEACDQYLELLKQRPQWVSEDLYQVRRVFEQANRSVDLVHAIQNVNLKLFTQPYYVIDLVSNLMRPRGGTPDAESLDLALDLFEKIFEAFPQYRNQLVSRMRDQNLWKTDRVFELGKKALIPTVSEVAASPWFGLDNIYSYSSGGKVNAQFHQILNGVSGTEKMDDLAQAIQSRLQEAPGWHGGQAMLALIELKQDRQTEAKTRLDNLVSDAEMLKTIPPHSCWLIGQELDQFEDTRPIAIKLFEIAVKGPNSMSQIEYSPVARIISLYSEVGRKAEARDLLIKQSKAINSEGYDQQYASYIQMQNAVWAAQQLLKLEYPIDAVRMFHELSQDPAAVEAAGQRYGGRPDYFTTQVVKGLKDSLAAVDSADAGVAIRQLLAVPEKTPSNGTAIDLMLMVPDISKLRESSMQSPMIDLLVRISKEQSISEGIRQRLRELRSARTNDLSIVMTESAYLLRMNDKNVDESLQQLVAAVAANPLEEIRPGRRANSRQRRESLTQLPLWLIARECLKSKERNEFGAALAERALEAARRQMDDQHTAAVLYDWGKIALDQGDHAQAEAKWTELLDIVARAPGAKRPSTKAQSRSQRGRVHPSTDGFVLVVAQSKTKTTEPDDPSPGPASRRIPPLTLSKFRLTMEIALAAAENGMPRLSRKAVAASMRGGAPIPESGAVGNADPFGGPVLVRPSTANPTGTNSSAIDTEVAESLRKVIAKWQGDAYPASEVYEILLPIVFPENRPTEVMIYADSSKLDEAQVSSLGELLVRWARTANQLDDLSARLEKRKKLPQGKVAALVMQCLVELARDHLDDANVAISELAELVTESALPPMVQLACHAALPAAEHVQLEKPAYAILELAVNLQLETAAADRNNSSNISLGKLVAQVNRHLADKPEAIKKFYESFLVSRQSYYSRYSGTYGQYLQWRDWAAIAEEAAKSGLPTVALDYMGRVTDFSYENNPRPSTTTAMAVVCRELALQSPEQRYAAWRDWTLPMEGRQTIRFVAEWVEPVRVPSRFLQTTTMPGEPYQGDLLSNFTELLTVAEATGHLEELRDLVKPAYDQKLENAAFLYALILIQLGDVQVGKPVIEALVSTVTERLKRVSGQPRPDGMGDFLVYRACLQSRPFVSLYSSKKSKLHAALRSISAYQPVARINVDFALREGQPAGITIQPGDDPQLDHWFPATTRESVPRGGKPWWIAQEGHLAHLAGADSDLLYFKYPLTGEFEFTVDGFKGSWTETEAGYGGVIVESQQYGSRTNIWSTGGHETITQPQPLRRSGDSFGTITIKVADRKMQYLLNNHVVYEEEVNDTNPWITLYSHYTRATSFRNPRITGNPVIPRAVPLVSGDRMDGWNTSFYGDSQPRRRLMAIKTKSDNDSNSYSQRNEPAEFDWEAKDDLLTANVLGGGSKSRSWAYYHRPLRDQEAFSYEFYYVPGEMVAHPTIGRVALLLEDDGVAEHWLTRTNWDEPVLGIKSNNRVTVKEARQGPQQLPLKPGDWNRISLALADGTIQLTLNDALIYKRALEPEIDHRFGVFRRKSQALKVRQPKLTGNWPSSLDETIRGNLLGPSGNFTTNDRRLVNNILTEGIFEHDVANILAEIEGLAPLDAFAKLVPWVLPSSTHSNGRLYYEFDASGGSGSQELRCPAVEMVALADQVGKLPELTQAVDGMRTYATTAARAQVALATLCAIQAGDHELALALMANLHEYISNGLSKAILARDRAPELVVAWQAAKVPALRFAAYDLARELADKQRNNKFKRSDATWDTAVNILAGHVDNIMLTPSFESTVDPQLAQWTNVPYYKPDMRAKRHLHTDWLYQPGVVQHVPGGTWGQLYFQSPLRGKFTIAAQRSLHGYRDLVIAYGMHAAEPRWDFKAARVSTVMHATKNVAGAIEIPRRGGWLADFRIEVDGKRITTFVNDVQIHDETLAASPDPWLLLQAAGPGYQSTVRNLRIIGNPSIPDEIDLIGIAGWASWRADVFGESLSVDENNASAQWKKVGDEIHGQLRENVSVANLESLLMYQRPLLEDGVVEFDAFYVPGEFEVHPAIGRLALMVAQDGVSKHVLTNAQYESNGLVPNNAEPIEGAASQVALKENSWNHFKLKLVGDQLTLAVNETDIAQVTLTEPNNQRYFGLFRYGNRTKARVRNLVYRGNWPKVLPPMNEQQLASTSSLASISRPTKRMEFDLSTPAEKLAAAGLRRAGPADRFTPVDDGTRLLLKESSGYGSWPRLHLRTPIEGDCTVTLDFDDLKMKAPQKGWGTSFILRATVVGTTDISVEAGVAKYVSGVQNINSVRRHKTLAGKEKNEGRYIPVAVSSGRLRLVRNGSLISTFYAEKGSDDFQLAEIWPVGDGPIKAITVQPGASDAEATLEVLLNQLTIETQDSPRAAFIAK